MVGGSEVGAIVTLAEAQAFARIETGEEDALVAGLVRSASALCEAFLGQAVIARDVSEQISASSEWQRLKTAPMRSIDEVKQDGVVVPAVAYVTDIDANGCGWVRTTDGSVTGTLQVVGAAGIALDENGVPEPIRQGVLRLVAYLFASRDGDGGEIPAAVTALWRPYRRLQFA